MGQVVERKGRWGRFFYGCRRYPECKFTAYHRPIAEACPDCGRAYLLEKETKKEGKVVFCGNESCHYKQARGRAATSSEAAEDRRRGHEEEAVPRRLTDEIQRRRTDVTGMAAALPP